MRHLEFGVDDDKITKWASDEYMEHLIRKREAVDSGDYGTARTTQDALLEASLNHKYSLAPSRTKKEQGVKINTDLAFTQPVKEDKKEGAASVTDADGDEAMA